jgi:hypothetical protein
MMPRRRIDMPFAAAAGVESAVVPAGIGAGDADAGNVHGLDDRQGGLALGFDDEDGGAGHAKIKYDELRMTHDEVPLHREFAEVVFS